MGTRVAVVGGVTIHASHGSTTRQSAERTATAANRATSLRLKLLIMPNDMVGFEDVSSKEQELWL